jgi:hypothetical protein
MWFIFFVPTMLDLSKIKSQEVNMLMSVWVANIQWTRPVLFSALTNMFFPWIFWFEQSAKAPEWDGQAGRNPPHCRVFKSESTEVPPCSWRTLS